MEKVQEMIKYLESRTAPFEIGTYSNYYDDGKNYMQLFVYHFMRQYIKDFDTKECHIIVDNLKDILNKRNKNYNMITRTLIKIKEFFKNAKKR